MRRWLALYELMPGIVAVTEYEGRYNAVDIDSSVRVVEERNRLPRLNIGQPKGANEFTTPHASCASGLGDLAPSQRRVCRGVQVNTNFDHGHCALRSTAQYFVPIRQVLNFTKQDTCKLARLPTTIPTDGELAPVVNFDSFAATYERSHPAM